MSINHSNFVNINSLYGSNTTYIDIGYVFKRCKGDLKINTEYKIGFYKNIDEVRLNNSLQKIKVLQTNEERNNNTYSVYIEPSNKVLSFLSGIDYKININGTTYSNYHDIIFSKEKITIEILEETKKIFKRRLLYNEKTIYYDITDDGGGVKKNIFFSDNINVVACNIYSITHLYKTLKLDQATYDINDSDTYDDPNNQLYINEEFTTGLQDKTYTIEKIEIPSKFIDDGILLTGTELQGIKGYEHYICIRKPFEGLVFFYLTINTEIKTDTTTTTDTYVIYLKYNGNLLNTIDAPNIAFLEFFRDNINIDLLDYGSYFNIKATNINIEDIEKWTEIINLHNTPKQNCIYGNVLYNNLITPFTDNSNVDVNTPMKKYDYLDMDTFELKFKYMDASANPSGKKNVRIFNIDGIEDASFNLGEISTDPDVSYVSFWFGNENVKSQTTKLDIYDSPTSYLITVETYEKHLEDGSANRIYMKFTDNSEEINGAYDYVVVPDTMVVSLNGFYFNVHPFYGPIDPEKISKNDLYLYPEYLDNLMHVFELKQENRLETVDFLFEDSQIQLQMDILKIKEIKNQEIIYEMSDLIENLRYFELFNIDILLNYYQYAITEINNHYIDLINYNQSLLEKKTKSEIDGKDMMLKNKISKISDDTHLYIHFDKYRLNDIFSEDPPKGIIDIVMLFSSVIFEINSISYICFQDTELDISNLHQKVFLKHVKDDTYNVNGNTQDIKMYIINEIATKKYYSTIQFSKTDHYKPMISFKFRYYVYVYKYPFIMNENNEKEEQDNLQVEYNKVIYIKYDDPKEKTNPELVSSSSTSSNEEIITPKLSNVIYFHVRGNIKIEQINDPVVLYSTETNIYDRIYGNNHIVEIQNKDTHIYNGFFKCNGLDASANIKIDNLHVEVNSKYINQGQGLIVSKDSSFMKMMGCSSYSPYIQKYGGGLVGSDSSNCVVQYSYSNAKIHQGGGGIFGRGAESCLVYGSYSMGEIIMGGGIFGNDASNCTVEKSYTTGQIHAASGGIFGNYARDSNAFDAFSTSENIYPLSGSVFGNYAIRCHSERGTIPLDGSRNVIDTPYLNLQFEIDNPNKPHSMTEVDQIGAFSKDCHEFIDISRSAFKDDKVNDPDDVDNQCKECLYHVFINANHANNTTDDNDKGDGYEYPIWYVPETFHISSHILHRGTFLKNTLRNYNLHSFPFANLKLHTEILKFVKTNNLRTDTIHEKQLILYENMDITNTSFKYTGVDPTIEDLQINALFEEEDIDPSNPNVYIACFLNIKYDNLSFVLPDGYIVIGDSGTASILQIGGDPDHIRKYIQPIILSIIQVDSTTRTMRMKSGIDIINKKTFDDEKYDDAYKYLNETGVQRITNTQKLYKNGRLQLYLNNCYFIFNPFFYIFDGGKHNIDISGIEDIDGIFYNKFNYNPNTIHEQPHIKNLKITNGKTNKGGGIMVRSTSIYVKVSECTTTGEIDEEGGGIFGKGCKNCVAVNSYSSGKIGYGGGGIFGAESENCTASTCYTSGEIVQGGGGITGMESKGNHLSMCFTNGIVGPFSGGLIGAYGSSPYTVDRCYTTGDISYSAGGFIGAYTDYENFKETIQNDDTNYNKDFSNIDKSIISYSYVSGKLYDYSSYFYGAGSFYKLDSAFKYVYTTTNELLNNNSNNNYDNNKFATANTHVYNTIQSFFLDENDGNEYNNPYGNDSFKPPDEPEMDPKLYNTLLKQFELNGFIKDTFGIQSYVLLKSFYDNTALIDDSTVKVWKNYYHYNDNPILYYEFILINNDIDIFAPVFLDSVLVSESFVENKYIYTVKLPNYHITDEISIALSRAYSLEQLRNPNINNPFGDFYIDYTKEENIKKYYLPDTHTIVLKNYDVVNQDDIVYTNTKTPYHFVYPSWMYTEIFNDNLLSTNPNSKSIYSIQFDNTNIVLNLNVKDIYDDTNGSVFANLNIGKGNDKDKERYYIGVFYEKECIFYLPVYRKSDIFIKLKYTIDLRLNNNNLRYILYDSETIQLMPIYITAIQRKFKNRGLTLSEKRKFIKEKWNQKIMLDNNNNSGYDKEKINKLRNYPGYFETDEFDIWFKVYHKYIYSHDDNEGGTNTSLRKLDYNKNYYAKNRRGELIDPYLRYEVNDVRLYYSKDELTIEDIRNNFRNKESFLKNDVLLNNDALLSSTSEMEKYLNELRKDFIKYE